MSLTPDPEPTGGCRHKFRVSCGNCRLNAICLPIALEETDVERLDQIIQRGRPIQKNEHIYRQDDNFYSVYAVRSGAIKAYHITDDGSEQVTGFYLPGEIFGMDGIAMNRHTSSARALETSSVCEIPFQSLGELSQKIPNLQRHFFQLMGQEIAQDQVLLTLLSKNTAEQRIATLLLSISARNRRRGLSSSQYRLPMSRTDIGNYLGLTVETVSRVLSRLHKQELIRVDNKEIELLNETGLGTIANLSDS